MSTSTQLPAIPQAASLEEIRRAFRHEQIDALPIIDPASVLRGVVLLRELAATGGEPDLENVLCADDLAAGRQIVLTGSTLGMAGVPRTVCDGMARDRS